MQSIQSLVFLGITVIGYAAAWAWAVMLVDACRRRAAPWVLALIAAGVGAAVVYRATSTMLLGLPVAVAGAAAYYFAVVRSDRDWRLLKQRKEDARQVVLHLVLLTGAVAFAVPYLWMVLTSLKPDQAIFTDPLGLPDPWKWSNYPRAFAFLETALGRIRTGFGSLFALNTLEVTALSMASMLLSSTLVAYSFARLRWPGRDLLFLVLLGTMMLPGAVTLIPRFIIFKELGWVDTLLPLWVPSLFASAFDVFLLRQFLMTIPTELEDAAKIDGCGYFTIYWRVMLPLIKPAIAALAIMHFLNTWNDFMGPLVYVSSPAKMTGSYALRLFQSSNAATGEWAMLLCAATMWTLPVVLLFFFAQRAFIEGITLTGMKN